MRSKISCWKLTNIRASGVNENKKKISVILFDIIISHIISYQLRIFSIIKLYQCPIDIDRYLIDIKDIHQSIIILKNQFHSSID